MERKVWSKLRTFRSSVFIWKNAEALEVAAGWRVAEQTIWTDGSGIEGRGVGSAVVWRQRAHTPPPWGPSTRGRQGPGEPSDSPTTPRECRMGDQDSASTLEKTRRSSTRSFCDPPRYEDLGATGNRSELHHLLQLDSGD